MSYSKYTLEKVKQSFKIKTSEQQDYLRNLPRLDRSQLLTETPRTNVAITLASNREKARSEMIIAPILIDLKRQKQQQINLLSGIKFTYSRTRTKIK